MTAPRVSAIVGVCDEVELIEPCIRHLLGIGADSIVVVDIGSSDGTEEVLAALEAAGAIAVVRREKALALTNDFFDEGVRFARARFNPDWIVLQDADEFWLPATGTLPGMVDRATRAVLRAARYNACLPGDRDGHHANLGAMRIADLPIFVSQVRLSRDALDGDSELRWISARPMDKVMARADVIGGVGPGGHVILGPDREVVDGEDVPDSLIVHLPFTSFARFRRKVVNIARLLADSPTFFEGQGGWHWKRWVELLREGGLEAEFEHQAVGEDEMRSLRAAGIVMSGAEWLAKRDAPTAG